jgi:ABC-2 type transport system ATP-binding protein
VPEGVPLYPEMRVAEYLRFRARLKGVPRSGRASAVGRALEQAGVADVRRRIIGTLSRGYRQRAGLADALLAEPRVLILDEPTVGLDPEQVRQFRQLLKDVGKERTVVLSTHILSEVEIVCSSVVIIHKGKVIARDSAEDLKRRLGATETAVAEIDGPPARIREALSRDPQVARVSMAGEPADEGRAGYHVFVVEPRAGTLRELVYEIVAPAGGGCVISGRQVRSLEDVFVGLVGEPSPAGPSTGREVP